jgi:hypothetical protein
LLFIAAKQAVATKYISLKKNRPPSSYSSHAKSCADAARQNSLLSRQLLESNQAAAFSTLDYHYAFTAAIVLQLVRLVPDTNVVDDSDKISSLSEYLCKSGDKGNESARDCARMVMELGAVVTRLLANQKTQMITNGASSNVATNNAIGQAPERMPYLPGQGLLLQAGEDLSNSFLVSDVPPRNQSETYHQLFSWFQDTTF